MIGHILFYLIVGHVCFWLATDSIWVRASVALGLYVLGFLVGYRL